MVSGEWVPGSDLIPLGAHVHVGVVQETADVGSSKWDSCNTIHHNSGDGVSHI